MYPNRLHITTNYVILLQKQRTNEIILSKMFEWS